MRKKLLELRHREYRQNTEAWYDDGQEKILCISDCPTNFPSKSETKFTIAGAMRNFILLTNEGWEVEEDHGWFKFIENLEA